MKDGYDDLLKGDAVYRPRLDLWMPCERPDGYYRWGTMEGASRKIGVFAIRMKSDVVYWPNGDTEEKYCMQPGTWCGLVMVFSVRNGEPLAIINDGLFQHMRVGGCAGLGAKYLAREDACDVGIFGSGGMARSYFEAFYEVRKLKKVKVYSPTKANRERFAREMTGKLDIEVVAVDEPEKVVREADIVATCTDSTRTVFDEPEWLKEGAHITCVRACEVGPKVIKSAICRSSSAKIRSKRWTKAWFVCMATSATSPASRKNARAFRTRRWTITKATTSNISWTSEPARFRAEPATNR